jgi:RNA recognition motif-containing protein
MLFEPFGELVRIDMKRNYAFIQFRTVEEATRAKETTNGGKLDQSVLTVEYVARQRENEGRPRGGDRPRGDFRSGRDDRDNRYNSSRNSIEDDMHRRRGDDYRRGGGDRGGGVGDRGGNYRDDRDMNRGNTSRGDRGEFGGGDRGGIGGGYDDKGRGGDDRYVRHRDSPPPYRGGGRNRSRSRSPPYGRGSSRSPPRRGYDDRDDVRRGGNAVRDGGSTFRGRGASPPGDSYARRGLRHDSPAGRGSSPGRYAGGAGDRGYRG